MSDLGSSTHFLHLGAVPEFDEATPFRDLYSEIYRRGASGFVVVTESGRRYVKGRELADEAIKMARSDAPDTLQGISAEPIGRVINKTWASQYVMTIPAAPVEITSDETPLQNGPDAVFSVAAGGRAVGWFLNHEGVLGTATGKTVWVCENGHDNPDSDHGTCYSCPGDIVGTRKVP